MNSAPNPRSSAIPKPAVPSVLAASLQAEPLETRLNLSTMQFPFSAVSDRALLAQVWTSQSSTRVISLTTPTEASAATVAAKKTALTPVAGKTLTPKKTVASKATTSKGGLVSFSPFQPRTPVRAQVPVKMNPPVVLLPTTTVTATVPTSTITTTPPATTPTPTSTTTTTTTPPTTPTTTPTTTTTVTTPPVSVTTTPPTSTPPVTTTPTTTTTTTPTTVSTTPTTTSTPTTPTPTSTVTTPTTPTPTPTPSSTTSTDSSNTTVSVSVSEPSLPVVTTPDPLAPILAQLYGDDVHDDSGTIQTLIDTAYANGYSTINLPAGTFKLDHAVHFYGSGVTITGQGASTILDVANNYDGSVAGNPYGDGDAFRVFATLDSNHLMIKQAVTGNTIVFKGAADVTVGESLFLSDGKGSTELIEKQLGGQDTGPGAFEEYGPDEYVQVTAVSTDANGDTVATLAQNIVGTGDYGNVSPTGASSTNYLNAVSIDTPANNLTLENFNVKFTDMGADDAFYIFYANHMTVKNIQILNSTTAGGLGGIGTVGSMNCTFSNITSPNTLGLNSTRLTTIENCSLQNVSLEESSTDNLISNNTLTNPTGWEIRINDMACARNTIQYNTMYGGIQNTGSIALMEGVDTVVTHNICIGQYAGIWTAMSQGDVFEDNTAPVFGNFTLTDVVTQLNNSWQTTT